METVLGKLLIKDPPRATSRVYVPVPWGMSLPQQLHMCLWRVERTKSLDQAYL
jgi:hypothetical protein